VRDGRCCTFILPRSGAQRDCEMQAREFTISVLPREEIRVIGNRRIRERAMIICRHADHN